MRTEYVIDLIFFIYPNSFIIIIFNMYYLGSWTARFISVFSSLLLKLIIFKFINKMI